MRKQGEYILFPKRGIPPQCPEGYEKEINDQYICVRILKSCEYREVIVKKTSCCNGNTVRWKCKKTGKPTTRLGCRQCKLV